MVETDQDLIGLYFSTKPLEYMTPALDLPRAPCKAIHKSQRVFMRLPPENETWTENNGEKNRLSAYMSRVFRYQRFTIVHSLLRHSYSSIE